jgi:hypothetical protein
MAAAAAAGDGGRWWRRRWPAAAEGNVVVIPAVFHEHGPGLGGGGGHTLRLRRSARNSHAMPAARAHLVARRLEPHDAAAGLH